VALLVVATASSACQGKAKGKAEAEVEAESPAPLVTVREEAHMGTYVTVSVAAAESKEVLAAIDAAFAEVRRAERLLSEWVQESDVSRVNQQAGSGAVEVGDELFGVIRLALEISRVTDGAFDVSFAALGGLWDFKAAEPRVPTREECEARTKLVGYRRVTLREGRRTVELQAAGMQLGLGGIAKGYIVDRASQTLKASGYPNHLVVAGGDGYAAGRRSDRKWRIAIRHPRDQSLYKSLEVEDQGFATSGNYEKFFIQDGVRYHHILDPRTGMPARGASSVSVIAASAAEADAYATALFVLGPQTGLALARKRGLAVLFFDDDYRTSASADIEQKLQPLPE